MIIRPARLSDFEHLETFVWQAIFPAFDVEGLSDAQRAENDALVENARNEIVAVLGREHYAVFVAIDPKLRRIAGFIIVDARPRAYAEIVRLIVKRSFQGKGVAALLLDEATEFIGKDRAVSLSVRHYNERAMAFFSKHGFEDTGEVAGNHAIPRTLMLREAHATVIKEDARSQPPESFGADFPSATDEPVFEELPDYRLATDETPLFQTGANALRTEDITAKEPEETSLSEEQLSVLEAFIAKARAQRSNRSSTMDYHAPIKQQRSVPQKQKHSEKEARRSIEFEVDYGNGFVVNDNADLTGADINQDSTTDAISQPNFTPHPKPSFSFDFSPVQREAAAQEHVVAPTTHPATSHPTTRHLTTPQPERTVKACPDCNTNLPVKARFCYVCGMPQPEQNTPEVPERNTSEVPEQNIELPDPDDRLELQELPSSNNEEVVGVSAGQPDASIPTANPLDLDKKDNPEAVARAKQETSHIDGPEMADVSVSDLRKAFRKHLEERIIAYFGERRLDKYLALLQSNSAFQQVRDGSLGSLAQWLSSRPAADLAAGRQKNTFADLTEYFIVETAGKLSGNVLPQRLLRHQSANWQTADLFKLVMDYLDFESESETVHSDFVKMPARALRNATKSFLHAAKDERVFFICDQSLISQAKNGFAITDTGIYWKNVLQPAGAATFTTMSQTQMEAGHLVIDGQFFDAGGRLNLKVALLLDKLRRMR